MARSLLLLLLLLVLLLLKKEKVSEQTTRSLLKPKVRKEGLDRPRKTRKENIMKRVLIFYYYFFNMYSYISLFYSSTTFPLVLCTAHTKSVQICTWLGEEDDDESETLTLSESLSEVAPTSFSFHATCTLVSLRPSAFIS